MSKKVEESVQIKRLFNNNNEETKQTNIMAALFATETAL